MARVEPAGRGGWLREGLRASGAWLVLLLGWALTDHLLAGGLPLGRATLAALAAVGLAGSFLWLPGGLLLGALGGRLARPWLARLELAFSVGVVCGVLWALAMYLPNTRLPLQAARVRQYWYGLGPAVLLGGLVWWKARAPGARAMAGARSAVLLVWVGGLWWMARYSKLYLQDVLGLGALVWLALLAWMLRARPWLARAGWGIVLLGVLGGVWLSSSGQARDEAGRAGRASRVLLRGTWRVLGGEEGLARVAVNASPSLTPPPWETEASARLARLEARRPRRIFLFTLDALRADLGGRPSVGLFARLDREALRFSRAYSPANNTTEAVTGLFFGRFHFTGLRGPSLARLFSSQGWQTLSIQPTSFLLSRGHDWMTQDFQHYSHELRYSISSGPIAEEQNALFLKTLGALSPSAPLFAWMHYNDAHAPYDAPGDTPLVQYQGEVARNESALARLLDELAARGMLDDALVIVSADHGEEFGEHGGATHGLALYDETLHIPLWIWAPGAGVAGEISSPVSTLGLPAWIARVAGLSTPPEFAPWGDLARAPLLSWRRGSATSETWEGVSRDDRYKLIYSRDIDAVQLYDLSSDPGERVNLADAHPDVVARLAAGLLRGAQAP